MTLVLSRFAAGAVLCAIACAQTPDQPANGGASVTIIRGQHHRLSVPMDIQRIAVGDPDMLTVEPLSNRELLLLGKNSGRTTLLVWFRDGSVREYICSIHRDLSLLQATLKRIHPSI